MKKEALIVVDMQNDFIDGALGTKEAQAIVDCVVGKIRNFGGETIFATLDTHDPDYLKTQEGYWLPVEHCIRGKEGWRLNSAVKRTLAHKALDGTHVVTLEKPTFGCAKLVEALARCGFGDAGSDCEVTLIGLCTDICVISNALLIKSFFPEALVTVDAGCCAGVTPESHNTALMAMQACQIRVENWGDES